VDTRRRGSSRVFLAAALVALSACVEEDTPSLARVVVQSSPAAPLLLVVSTDFATRFNQDTGAREAVLVTADTTYLTGAFDREFDMGAQGRVYVALRNDEATEEDVRMRVFLDGSVEYDVTDRISDGETLKYLFSTF